MAELDVAFLLGPPGSGKSTTVEMYCEDPGSKAVWELFSDIRTQFEARTILTDAYSNGNTLFLDAYDEATELDPRAFCKALKACRNATQLPKLRIVSRQARIETAIINDIVEAVLGQRDQSVNELVYTIDPLTPEQTSHYVSQRVPENRNRFWKEVRKHSLEGVLRWPVNLAAFVEVFNTDGHLGLTAAEAWTRSVEIQLSETNVLRTPGRRLQARTGLNERIELVRLLAAADVLCRQFPIAGDQSTGRGLTTARLFRDFASSHPTWASREIEFTLAIKEVIDTRIFENHGGLATFSSMPIAQFLAAEFISTLSLPQILQLFRDSKASERICDAASPVAAELARFHPDLFGYLCEHQPDVFLTTVLFSYSNEQRYRIVESFLNRREFRSHYARGYQRPDLIKHPRLGEQLRPFLLSHTGNDEDLALAIDMAAYCGVDEVVPELKQIACDESQPYRARTNAADALASLGASGREALMPLLRIAREEDPDDELFGSALRSLWPAHVPPEEIFTILRDPQDGTGSYRGFLRYYDNGAPFRISRELVRHGLAWMRNQELLIDPEPWQSDAFDVLHEAIVFIAWENLAEDAIAESLAELSLVRLRNASRPLVFGLSEEDRRRQTYGHPKVLPPSLTHEVFLSDQVRRFKLFGAWRKVLDPPTDYRLGHEFMDRRGDSGTESDLKRLLVLSSESDTDREILRETIKTLSIVLLLKNGLLFLKALDASLRHWNLDLRDLQTEALGIKVRQIELDRPRCNPEFDFELSIERFENALVSNEILDLGIAIHSLVLGTTGYLHQYATPDDSPLWQGLSEERRQLFREKAKEYVVTVPAQEALRFDPRFFSSGTLDNAMWLLRWLAKVEQNWCAEHIQDLIPALRVNYLTSNFEVSKNEFLICLNKKVHAETLASWFHEECAIWKKPFDFGRVGPIDEIWSDDLAVEFSRLIAADSCTENTRFQMLGAMVVHKAPQVAGLLINDLKAHKSSRKGRAVELILTHHVNETFSELSEVASQDSTVFAHIWRCLWDRRRIDSPAALVRFDSKVLKRLFSRACKLQPPREDEPFGKGPRRVTPRMQRASTRDAIYSALLNKDDETVWQFLVRWSRKDGFDWIADHVRNHRNAWLGRQWNPADLSTVSALKLRPDSLLIRSDLDLLRLTLRELKAVEIDITQNEVFNNGKEVEITAVVASFLNLRLGKCTVNCEANARPVGKRRTDIQIEVVTLSQKLKCVIETKRCVNVNPSSDVTKLRSEYLHPSETATGIYLIYRYSDCSCAHCKKWGHTELLVSKAVAQPGHVVKWQVWQLHGRAPSKSKLSSLRRKPSCNKLRDSYCA